MKFKIGDRIRYHNEDSENDGRIGVVIGVSNYPDYVPYHISLDSTETKPNYMFWIFEDALEPYSEDRTQEPETFRDRLKREHPDCVDDKYVGGCLGCPHEYGYESKAFESCGGINSCDCSECWNRPISATVTTSTCTPTDISPCKRGICKCGALVNSSYTFCPNCGVKLDWGE